MLSCRTWVVRKPDGGIYVLINQEREARATVVAYVVKVNALAYQDQISLVVEPGVKKVIGCVLDATLVLDSD